MDTRASIEAILDKAYAARRGNDAEAAAACFCEDGLLHGERHAGGDEEPRRTGRWR